MPAAADDARRSCEALQAALPDVVQGQRRRGTSPTSELTAAWGDPPIVLRCGVPAPAVELQIDQQPVEVDGVTWQPQPAPDGYLFTSLQRAVPVEVRVPHAYAPEVNPLVDLAPAIKAAMPSRG